MSPDSSTRKYNTANPYEAQFGYSRAIRRGPFIFVSGTTSVDLSNPNATNSPQILHPSSAYHQALQAFTEIIKAVEGLGGKKDDIVRVRMFVGRDEDANEVGKALNDMLGFIAPTATMIVGARFIHTEMRVEIEADAVCIE